MLQLFFFLTKHLILLSVLQRLILRIDVEIVLSDHCNANYFSTISIRDIHEGS